MARAPSHCFVSLLVAVTAMAAHAQPSPSATVRVKIADDVTVLRDRGPTVVGELLRRDSSALLIRQLDPPAPTRIPIARIEWATDVRVGVIALPADRSVGLALRWTP